MNIRLRNGESALHWAAKRDHEDTVCQCMCVYACVCLHMYLCVYVCMFMSVYLLIVPWGDGVCVCV